MSEIIMAELTFRRLEELVESAGDEGFMVVGAQSSPTKLTQGKEYRLFNDGQEMYFEDDSDLPVYIRDHEDLAMFEPIVDPATLTCKLEDVRGRTEHRVVELVKELVKISQVKTDFKIGDIVVLNTQADRVDAKPYVVAKILTPEEVRFAASVVETLMAHELLVYHLDGSPLVSILQASSTTRIGSLEEWGMDPLDPLLVEKLTVFSAAA